MSEGIATNTPKIYFWLLDNPAIKEVEEIDENYLKFLFDEETEIQNAPSGIFFDLNQIKKGVAYA